MFKYIKSIFAPEDTFELTNTFTGTEDETEFGVSRDGTARLRQMKNGKFRLLVNTNEVIGTYSRRRDAIRGAERKGLTIVS